MKSPKVSILIPVFNRKSYISDCIQSALDQTISSIEIIIVDNASNDGTWEICQEYANRDQRIRIFRNDTNIGPVRNWKKCLDPAPRGLSHRWVNGDINSRHSRSMTVKLAPYPNVFSTILPGFNMACCLTPMDGWKK